MHFCELTARRSLLKSDAGSTVPRKMLLYWFIPAFANSSVGSSYGIVELEGTNVWSRARKNSRKVSRTLAAGHATSCAVVDSLIACRYQGRWGGEYCKGLQYTPRRPAATRGTSEFHAKPRGMHEETHRAWLQNGGVCNRPRARRPPPARSRPAARGLPSRIVYEQAGIVAHIARPTSLPSAASAGRRPAWPRTPPSRTRVPPPASVHPLRAPPSTKGARGQGPRHERGDPPRGLVGRPWLHGRGDVQRPPRPGGPRPTSQSPRSRAIGTDDPRSKTTRCAGYVAHAPCAALHKRPTSRGRALAGSCSGPTPTLLC